MNLHLRPPTADEWPICRMLLPETFADQAPREYLLCLRDEAPRIVGAAAYQRRQDRIARLRLHVVKPFRRQRVGSQMLSYIARSGARLIAGNSEISREAGAEAFCRRNRMERVNGITTVEGDIQEMREHMGRLRARLARASDARVMRLADAPGKEVAELHARHVAHDGDVDPWRALVANAAAMSHSPVVMIDGRVAGMLLWELDRGTAVVRTRVAAPGARSAAVNVILLAEALDGAWAAGARRTQFSYADSNHDTRKLAARFRAGAVSEVAQFQRAVAR
jgi:hypothetical protein